MLPVIAITPGEPAGIGPDLIVQLAQKTWPAQLVAIADPDLLFARAKQRNLPLTLPEFNPDKPCQQVTVLPEKLSAPAVPGRLNVDNADYVLRTLRIAAQGCLDHTFDALLTGPVHKGIINDAGIAFSGHTEFLADFCQHKQVVMLLTSQQLRVALVTTHLPLSKVSEAISQEKIMRIVPILVNDLKKYFQIEEPHIFVAGLNPHAGENGHLGEEEITVISPALETLRNQGYLITGPLAADTMFSKRNLAVADAFLCMYHDQGLPVLKYAAFGHAANITLGLPFLRASVDHGTALELAGTANIDSGSFEYALQQTLQILQMRKPYALS